MAKRRAHRGAQRFGIHRIRAAAQQETRRGPERVCRANQRPDVAGILDAVDDEDRTGGHGAELPRARLHDRENPLRGLGAREVGEHA